MLADGEEILEIPDAAAYENSLEGWRFDPNDRRGVVFVKLAKRSTSVPAKVLLDVAESGVWPAFEPYPVPEITPELDKAEFKVVASSEQNDGKIGNAFDGSPETIWHSNWSDASVAHPYTIDIDVGKLAALNGFGYLPRENFGNGSIKDYEIYVSRAPGAFGEPVAKGAFPREFDPENPGKPKFQHVSFPTTWGRYVRVKILSSLGGDRFGSAAEFDLTQDLEAAPLADETLDLGDKTGVVPAEIKGKAVFNRGIAAPEIVVDGEKYAKGITAGVGSEIVYELDGSWDRVLGFVGREAGGKGTVTFRIFADGKQVFERAGMSPTSVKQLIAVDISGAKKLVFQLVGDEGGDASDTGVWTDVKLLRKGSEE